MTRPGRPDAPTEPAPPGVMATVGRWLVVPGLVALLAMVALAASADQRTPQRDDDRTAGPSDTGPGDRSDPLDSVPATGAEPGGSGEPRPDITAPTTDTTTSTTVTAEPAADTTASTATTGDGPTGDPDLEEQNGDTTAGDDQASRDGGAVSFEVWGPAGALHVRLEPDPAGGVAATVAALDGTRRPGDRIDLRPEMAGGRRLGADGTLQPIGDTTELEPGAVAVQAIPHGVAVPRPDGTRVEIGPDPSQVGGLAIADLGPDGRAESLGFDDDGRLDLGDGLSLQLPTGAEDPATMSRWLLLAAVLVVAAVLLVALAIRRRRRAGGDAFDTDRMGPAGVSPDHFDAFVAMLAADPDPGRAIRLAFLAAERGIGGLPVRRSVETPFEWAYRVIDERPELQASLGPLTGRFAVVRFGDRPATPADRDAALLHLRHLERAGRPPSVVPPVATAGTGR